MLKQERKNEERDIRGKHSTSACDKVEKVKRVKFLTSTKTKPNDVELKEIKLQCAQRIRKNAVTPIGILK